MAGETVATAAARCGVAYTTAFRWRHRFLMAPARDKPTRLVGIVEADETFILKSFKGRRAGLPRASRKRGGKPKKTGLSAEQIPVLVARDRTGATIDGMLPKLDKASVSAVLAGVVTSANQLCCDGGKAIAAFARIGGIPYHVLPKPGGPKPEAPICISTTSMPTIAASSNGCVRSMGWRRRTCLTTSVGAERSRHSHTPASQADGLLARWEPEHINRQDQSSFMRRAEPGNWREHLSPAANKAFIATAGDVLALLGYDC